MDILRHVYASVVSSDLKVRAMGAQPKSTLKWKDAHYLQTLSMMRPVTSISYTPLRLWRAA